MMPMMLESRMLLCFLSGLAGIQSEKPAMEARQDGKKIMDHSHPADGRRAARESARRWTAYAICGGRPRPASFGVHENGRM